MHRGGHRGQESPGWLSPLPLTLPAFSSQAEEALEQLHFSSAQEEKEKEIRSPPEPVSPLLSPCCPERAALLTTHPFPRRWWGKSPYFEGQWTPNCASS